MALKRENLKAIGLNEEQIGSVVEWHRETVDGLKAQLDEANKKADLYDEAKKKLDDYDYEKEDWKKKYEDEHGAFEKFKTDTEVKETTAKKSEAYTGLLKEMNVSEKRIPSILKLTNLDDVELAKDGTVKNADKLKETIKAEWSDFIVTTGEKGADVANPPANNGGNTFDKMTLMEKMQFANEHPNDKSVKDWLAKK